MAKRDYYEILGIARTASADEIRKAHRKLVRQFHPDVNKNNPQMEAKFKEVQEAYDVLSDDAKRRQYDQFGHAGVGAEQGYSAHAGGADPFEAFRRAQEQAGRRGAGSAGPRAGYRRWQPNPNVSVEDFDMGGDAGGFADIFEQFFGQRGAGGAAGAGAGGGAGGARGGRQRAQPPRGEDIEYPVTLTFAQAARGMTLPLQISRDGKLETIDVKIPAGVKEGSRVRIKGKGQHTNGEPGDLFIVTRVLPHHYFRREGLDIQMDLPISMYEALLGTKLEVPTLDGPVTMTIPPGTSSGAKLRIKERGIHRGAEKGDQYVMVKVLVPKSIDEEDKQLLQKLQAKHPIEARKDVNW
jgi:curved DNA-binding protein